MALKVLMLRKKLTERQTTLTELREKEKAFEAREAELETAIEEAQSDDERAAVEALVEAFEAEKTEKAEAVAKLTEEIAEIENQIKDIEELAPAAAPESRKEQRPMETRKKFFGMTAQERDAFFADSEVKEFLQRTRELATQKRAVAGAELLIPTVVLDLIKENIDKYSKLIGRVRLRSVPGKARQNIMGTVPEAIWTEMCAALNELNLSFNDAEVDGYKVGGYIAICNALLEDSDIALATEIISALGQAIGYALDKAILYGTGNKMPLGIVTRLAQTAKPSDYRATSRPWTDLHTTNMIAVKSGTKPLEGIELYKGIIRASGAAKGKHSAGAKFWAMSDTTYTTLLAEAMSVNAVGAIVSGQTGAMPIIGGDIVLLDFIPDGELVGGYGDLYLLAERAGTHIAQSEHARFVEDQTVFKGTARYDGLPVIPEGFVAISIDAGPVTTAIPFAPESETPETEG